MLGTPALFATAYGNVGSSIYYALGVTAVFALGLTPLVFVDRRRDLRRDRGHVRGGTVRYPEAGGSSSFARHAFNELVSFGAAWAQMLNYVDHDRHLGVLRAALPLDLLGAAAREPVGHRRRRVVIVVLVALNIVGIQEAANLNISLAVIDFATQLLLVMLGFVLVFSPRSCATTSTGASRRRGRTSPLAIPVAMIAYTGIETVSNLAEEARDPVAAIPRVVPARRGRGLRDLLHAAARSRSRRCR